MTFRFEGANMRTYIDLETLPSLAPDAREQARQGVKPPGNYKKPETIAEWWKTEGEAAAEDAYRRQALDATTGELCAVGFCTDDTEPVSIVRERDEAEPVFLRRALDQLAERVRRLYCPGWPGLAGGALLYRA